MPTPTIPAGNLFMNATTYTGTGATQTITNGVAGQSFQPDFVWIKNRSSVTFHSLWDSNRGRSAGGLASNDTMAEQASTAGNDFVSFNSNGFSVGPQQNWNVNGNATNLVGWQWKAGGTAVSNTDGTITSQVSANTTSGFSVVTYTGTGSNATVGHGLGVAPKMIIVKNRVDGGPNWYCYHASLPSASYTLYLNLTNAQDSATAFWNNTAPTSSVFSVGTSSGVNGSTNGMVAYCWSEIAGFSKFGSYTGNGSTDGPFIYTGFRPRWVMMKKTNGTGNWYMWDSQRIIPANGDAGLLYAESASAESDYNAAGIDLLSNGFKLRNADSSDNGSGDTFVYAAFAENPLKFANAR